MSQLTQQIYEQLEQLPESLQQEALHYIGYLKIKADSLDAGGSPQRENEPNGTRLARLMEEIASRGTAFQAIGDPVAWQREIRKDRPLPGRE